MNYDVIIAGAGSVGVPTAMALAELGIETAGHRHAPFTGAGRKQTCHRRDQGHPFRSRQNTHLPPFSRNIFHLAAAARGQHRVVKRGICIPGLPAGRRTDAERLLPLQKKSGLNIDFVGPQTIQESSPASIRRGCAAVRFRRMTAPFPPCWR